MASRTKSRQTKSSGSTKPNVESTDSTPIDSDLRFFKLRPNGHRQEWAIQAYKTDATGKRTYQKSDTLIFKELKSKVDPINDKFQKKLIDKKTAEDMLDEIIDHYLKRGGTRTLVLKRQRLSTANQRLLEDFWEKRYGHKILADEKSARYRFARALKIVDKCSLYTAEPREIMIEIKKNSKNTNQQREVTSAINEILKHLNRDFRLQKPEEEYREVKYLTKDEVKLLAESAPTREFKLKTYVLFATGARTGEAHMINQASLGDRAVHITKQIPLSMVKSKTIKKPKRGKVGWAAVISSCWEYVQEWAKLDKTNMDRWQYYRWIQAQSVKLWPNDPLKHIKPHDLRHSHAIYLLDKGYSITTVARQLRNRVEICQKYYTGHEHTPESLETLRGKI